MIDKGRQHHNYFCRFLSIFQVFGQIYLACLDSPIEKSDANHLQELDFIFPLILALFVANLIFSCWAAFLADYIKQLEKGIKYIVLDEAHVTQDFSEFVKE